MSTHATCPTCNQVFTADASQEAAYHASLRGEDRAESDRLLGIINAYWGLRFHMAAAHPDQMVHCPRQGENPRFRGGQPEAFWKKDGTCSYCGSFSQDQFFAAVEAGAEVGPTDKNYKAYLRGESVPGHDGAAEFYYQHLDEAGKNRFIEMVNAKTMKIGMPGYFYSLPFFCRPVADP